MKRLLSLLTIALTLPALAHDLPKGISVKKAKTGEVIITLDKNATVYVTQEGEDRRAVIVANTEGTLEAIQLEKDGKTPVSVQYTSATTADIIITRHVDPAAPVIPLIHDTNGDGIPEFKTDATGKYHLKSIEWELIPAEGTAPVPPVNPTEPIPPIDPTEPVPAPPVEGTPEGTPAPPIDTIPLDDE